MPEKALEAEEKYRIIIYHGHLHKIALDDIKKEFQEQKKIVIEESTK